MERPRIGAIGVVERRTSGASRTEQHYPATAIGILEKAAETCRTLGVFQAAEKLSIAYPRFVGILKDGIERHKKIAEEKKKPWKGRINGERYKYDGEGPPYSGGEYIIIKANCIKLHSSIRYGGNICEVEIVGSPDGKNVTLVRSGQIKMHEGANKTGREIVSYIQVDFRNGVPTDLSIPPNADSPSPNENLTLA